jgi:CRP/FNR family transcriptional regulator, cyclic AMP receptor protein
MEPTLHERLAAIPIFARAFAECPKDAEHLVGVLVAHRFEPGAVILEEGEEGTCCYILHRGRVRVEKKTPQGDTYPVAVIDAGANAVFGEPALLATERRGAAIVADTEAQCYSLSKTDFDAMGDEHPRLGLLITREVARVQAQRLAKTNNDLITLFTAFVSEIEEG